MPHEGIGLNGQLGKDRLEPTSKILCAFGSALDRSAAVLIGLFIDGLSRPSMSARASYARPLGSTSAASCAVCGRL
jgi:hypothetical protein